MTKLIETMVTYTSKANPFNIVMIKSDDSFVIVGDDVDDGDLISMVNWEHVNGWDIK